MRLRSIAAHPLAGATLTGAALAAATFGLARTLGEERALEAALVYVLVTLAASSIWGIRIGIGAAVAANLLLNYYFTPPTHTFEIDARRDVVALLLFFAVAVIGASMLAGLQHQARLANTRKAEAETMVGLTRELSHAVGPEATLAALCSATTSAVGARGCELLQERNGWRVIWPPGSQAVSRDLAAIARRAVESQAPLRYGGATRARVTSRQASGPTRGGVVVPFGIGSPDYGALHVLAPLRPPPGVDVTRLLSAIANEAHVTLQRVRLEGESREREELQREDEFKNALLASVSHDLRTPLTAIKAAVGSLRDTSVPWTTEDREDFLATIEGETDRLTAVVGDLLQMNRLDSGALRPSIARIELRGFLEEAVRSARQGVPGRVVEVQASAPAVWASGDEVLLGQVIANLLENADHYSRPGGRIIVTTQSRDGAAEIRVADEGPGFSPSDLPRVFDKFYRGKSSAGTRGTGLGLSIVKAMVELSGGWVSASNVDGGACVRITLPSAPAGDQA